MPLFGPPNVQKLGARRDIAGLVKALAYKKDYRVRKAAAGALGAIGDVRALEPLIAALEDGHFDVRRAAAEALGVIGDARAVKPLSAALKDGDRRVREAAARALELRMPEETGQWRIRVAKKEEAAELVEAGDLSYENIDAMAMEIYLVLPPHDERLRSGDTVAMRGTLICVVCGNELPVQMMIGFKGFLDGTSKVNVPCSRCQALSGLAGLTTQVHEGNPRHWLVTFSQTGPPGSRPLPGLRTDRPRLVAQQIERSSD